MSVSASSLEVHELIITLERLCVLGDISFSGDSVGSQIRVHLTAANVKFHLLPVCFMLFWLAFSELLRRSSPSAGNNARLGHSALKCIWRNS